VAQLYLLGTFLPGRNTATSARLHLVSSWPLASSFAGFIIIARELKIHLIITPLKWRSYSE